MSGEPVTEGWGWPLRATKPHYFVDGHSLCGRWYYGGVLETGRARNGQDCKACCAALKRQVRPQAFIPIYSTPASITCGVQTEARQ